MEGFDGLGQRDQDASVRALLNNYRNQYPLALIVDNRYAPFPFDLGERMYVVLGLYWIVNAWGEWRASQCLELKRVIMTQPT